MVREEYKKEFNVDHLNEEEKKNLSEVLSKIITEISQNCELIEQNDGKENSKPSEKNSRQQRDEISNGTVSPSKTKTKLSDTTDSIHNVKEKSRPKLNLEKREKRTIIVENSGQKSRGNGETTLSETETGKLPRRKKKKVDNEIKKKNKLKLSPRLKVDQVLDAVMNSPESKSKKQAENILTSDQDGEKILVKKEEKKNTPKKGKDYSLKVSPRLKFNEVLDAVMDSDQNQNEAEASESEKSDSDEDIVKLVSDPDDEVEEEENWKPFSPYKSPNTKVKKRKMLGRVESESETDESDKESEAPTPLAVTKKRKVESESETNESDKESEAPTPLAVTKKRKHFKLSDSENETDDEYSPVKKQNKNKKYSYSNGKKPSKKRKLIQSDDIDLKNNPSNSVDGRKGKSGPKGERGGNSVNSAKKADKKSSAKKVDKKSSAKVLKTSEKRVMSSGSEDELPLKPFSKKSLNENKSAVVNNDSSGSDSEHISEPDCKSEISNDGKVLKGDKLGGEDSVEKCKHKHSPLKSNNRESESHLSNETDVKHSDDSDNHSDSEIKSPQKSSKSLLSKPKNQKKKNDSDGSDTGGREITLSKSLGKKTMKKTNGPSASKRKSKQQAKQSVVKDSSSDDSEEDIPLSVVKKSTSSIADNESGDDDMKQLKKSDNLEENSSDSASDSDDDHGNISVSKGKQQSAKNTQIKINESKDKLKTEVKSSSDLESSDEEMSSRKVKGKVTDKTESKGKGKTEVKSSSDSDSSDEEMSLRKVKEKVTKKTKSKDTQHKKKNASPEESNYVKKLKKICRECGIFVSKVQLEDAGYDTDRKKVKRLKQMLSDAGMKGNPSLSKVTEVRLKKEAAELDTDNILSRSGGRGKRKVRSLFSRNEPSPKRDFTPPRKVFSRLKGIVDSDESD